MNRYETVFIINPNVEEAGVKELIQKFSDIINNDGKVESVEELGKRKLAYEIKKNSEGIYVLINFEANPDLIKELERNYRITDDIIKEIKRKKCSYEKISFNIFLVASALCFSCPGQGW